MADSFYARFHQLLAAEWKRARDGRMTAARICSEPLMRGSLVWAARVANYRYLQHTRLAP